MSQNDLTAIVESVLAPFADNRSCRSMSIYTEVLRAHPHRAKWIFETVQPICENLRLALQSVNNRSNPTLADFMPFVDSVRKSNMALSCDPYSFAKITYDYIFEELSKHTQDSLSHKTDSPLRWTESQIHQLVDPFLQGNTEAEATLIKAFPQLPAEAQARIATHVRMSTERIYREWPESGSRIYQNAMRLVEAIVDTNALKAIYKRTLVELAKLPNKYSTNHRMSDSLNINNLMMWFALSYPEALKHGDIERAYIYLKHGATLEAMVPIMLLMTPSGSLRNNLIAFVERFKRDDLLANEAAFFAAQSIHNKTDEFSKLVKHETFSEMVQRIPEDTFVIEFVEVGKTLDMFSAGSSRDIELNDEWRYFCLTYEGKKPESLRVGRLYPPAPRIDLEIADFRGHVLGENAIESRATTIGNGPETIIILLDEPPMSDILLDETSMSDNERISIKSGSVNSSIKTGVVIPCTDSVKRIVIRPAGDLSRVTFDSLEGDWKGNFANYDLVYTSESPIFTGVENYVETPNIALFGAPDFNTFADTNKESLFQIKGIYGDFSPLPCCADEVTEIAEMLPNCTVRIGSEATKGALLDLDSPTILHLATHAFYAIDQIHITNEILSDIGFEMQRVYTMPQSGNFVEYGVVLSGVNTPDSEEGFFNVNGIMTQADISLLDLKETALVVLSCCNSALGAVVPNHGTQGVRECFLRAGAQTVLSSMWPVSDEVGKEIIVSFYKYFLQGKRASTALRLAKADARKKYSDTILWSGFVLLGKDLILGPVESMI